MASVLTKIRMYYHEDSESGKAVRMVNSADPSKVTRFVWLPKSMLEHITKFPKVPGKYQEWEITLPRFLVEQKTLEDFEVS